MAMVRLDDAVDRELTELAERTGESKTALAGKAIHALYEELFWAACDAGYAALRADPAAWAEEQDERAAWDRTQRDGLGHE